ncbi:MAG TPA: nuclear transport factor 2 family protein [Kiloniellales bacterium]|nr:nuclear transport factor 2 family protein [Kiloniellales bacterium]
MAIALSSRPVSVQAIKDAIESRDGRALASFYADHAITRVIDRNNPPSRPREIKGKAAITAFWDDICGRALTHRVDASLADGEHIAFTQACSYPDGARVFCMSVVQLQEGLIAEQTIVQAWDE